MHCPLKGDVGFYVDRYVGSWAQGNAKAATDGP